jgi:NAD(P)-dependent dehydrogenase (short-subunit alcohol dehydrogenase family)
MKKVCLFTGAGGALGSAFCSRYAGKYEIAAVYRRNPPDVPSQNQWLIDPLDPKIDVPENAHRVFAIQADLKDERERAKVVDIALARFERIDLLVNAAAYTAMGPLVESDGLINTAEEQFFVNAIVPTKMALLVARRFWRDNDRENGGLNRSVVNISSSAGVYLYPGRGQSAYGASKAALNTFTRHLASEFETFHVRVNATAPTSFPGSVSMESVLASIVRLDEGDMNGKILVLDGSGEQMT